jgi:hypothetical protein
MRVDAHLFTKGATRVMTLEQMQRQRQRMEDNQIVMPMWECAIRLELLLKKQDQLLELLRQVITAKVEEP